MPTDPPLLLTPGPVTTTARVRAALLRGDLCHREPEFATLLAALRADLVSAFGIADTHEAVLLTGSGTAAMESALTSLVRPGRAALVVNNGVYGQRLVTIARSYGIPAHEVRSGWTVPADPTEVAAALRRHPDVDLVCCVQHETTTGLLNPVAAIGAAVAGDDACYLVDAISALGAEPPPPAEVGADVFCGTANKALHGQPGVSFLLLSAAARRRVAEVPARGLYLAVTTHLDQQRAGTVPFTPAVPACYALAEALAEFAEEGGYPARSATYRQRAGDLRAGLAPLGLAPLVAPAHRAASVTAFPVPAGIRYPDLHDELKRRGFVVYAGQGPLAGGVFRVAVMGALPAGAIGEFTATAADVLAALRTAPR
jgi:2-aminoethylphosphonate-pyruvate transaminase